jgi:hypothetical protein
MPELRQAAKAIWDASGVDYQVHYEAIREPEHPPAFDEYLAQRDPLAPVKVHVNLIIKALDNDIVGAHVNKMLFTVIDLSASRHRLLLSDRSVEILNLKGTNGAARRRQADGTAGKYFLRLGTDARSQEQTPHAPDLKN